MKKILKYIAMVLSLIMAINSSLYAADSSLVSRIHVKERYGSIKKRVLSSKENHPFTIALIEDAHSNKKGQLNIAYILDELSKLNTENVIGIEGAWSEPEVNRYLDYPLESVKRKVFNKEFQKGRVSGAEYYASVSKKKLLPIENANAFLNNYEMYLQHVAQLSKSADTIRKIRQEIIENENRFISDRNRSFNAKYNDAKNYSIKIALLLKELKLIDAENDYLNLRLIEESLQKAKVGYPERVSFERKNIIEYLLDMEFELLPKERDVLKRKSPQIRKMNADELYAFDIFLSGLFKKFSNPRLAYAFFSDLNTRKILRSVDEGVLLREMESAKNDILFFFATSEEERDFLFLKKEFEIIERIVSLRSSRDEVEDYFSREEKGGGVCASFAARIGNRDCVKIQKVLQSAQRFYAASKRREPFFVEKILQHPKKGQTIIPLIAGGFHTAGIEKELRDRDISYVLISPRVSESDSFLNYHLRLGGQSAQYAFSANLNYVAIRLQAMKDDPALLAKYPLAAAMANKISTKLNTDIMENLRKQTIEYVLEQDGSSLSGLRREVDDLRKWILAQGEEGRGKADVDVSSILEQRNNQSILSFTEELLRIFNEDEADELLRSMTLQDLDILTKCLKEYFTIDVTVFDPPEREVSDRSRTGKKHKQSAPEKEEAKKSIASKLLKYGLYCLVYAGGSYLLGNYYALPLLLAMYRLGLSANIIANEMSHILAALVTRTAALRDVVTLRNVFGNVTLREWGKFFAVGSKINPFVSFGDGDVSPRKDLLVRRAGFIGSLLLFSCFSFFGLGLPVGDLLAVTSFFGLITGSGIGLLNAYVTDIKKTLPAGIYYCGNVGVLAALSSTHNKARSDEITEIYDNVLNKMLQMTQSRGEQAVGGVMYAKDKDSDGNTPFYYRMVNKKREYMTTVFLKKFAKYIKKMRPQWNSVAGLAFHVRFGTNKSGPSVDATHPHRGLLSKHRRLWKLSIPDGAEDHVLPSGEVGLVENYISHNGDFDGITMHGEELDLAKLRAFVNKIFDTKTTLEADSPHIAWVMDLFHTQGMWGPSFLLSFHQTVAESTDDEYPSLKDCDALAHECDEIFEWYANRIFHVRPEKKKQLLRLKKERDFTFSELRPFLAVDKEELHRMKKEIETKVLANEKLNSLIEKRKVRELVDQAVTNFIEMDMYEAMKLFMKDAKGSFGLVSSCTTHPSTYVMCSYKQPLSLGFSKEKNLVSWVSDSQSLLIKSKDKEVFDSKYDLDMPNGEIVQLTYDQLCSRFKLKSYGLKSKKETTRKNLLSTGRFVELKDNPYISYIDQEIKEAKDPIGQDLNDISNVIRTLESDFKNKEAWNSISMQKFINAFQDILRNNDNPQMKKNAEKKVDIVILGSETSFVNGKLFAEMINNGFGKSLGVRAKCLEPEDVLQNPADIYESIHENTICLSISQSGQSFPTYFATYFFNELLSERCFILSGLWDTPLSQLVQEVYKDSPFQGQIFSNRTGTRRSEPKTVTSTATWYVLNEMFLQIAEKNADKIEAFFNKTFQHRSTYQAEKYSSLLNKETIEMLRDQQDGTSEVSEKIVQDKRLQETGTLIGQHVLENLKGWLISAIFLGLLMLPNLAAGFPVLLPHTLIGSTLGALLPSIMNVSSLSLAVSTIGFFADVSFLVIMHYVAVSIVRIIEGRDLRARDGKRTVVIADSAPVAKLTEYYIRALFGMSRNLAAIDVHSSENNGHLIHEYHRAVTRGCLVDIGIADSEPTGTTSGSVQMIINQVQGIAHNNPLIRLIAKFVPAIKPYGAEVHTIGQDNPNTGKFDVGISYRKKDFERTRSSLFWYETMYASLDRYIAKLVKYHRAAKDVSTVNLFTGRLKFLAPVLKTSGLAKILRHFFGYRFWSSHSGTNVATTATTTSPQNMLEFLNSVSGVERLTPLTAQFVQPIDAADKADLFFSVEQSDEMPSIQVAEEKKQKSVAGEKTKEKVIPLPKKRAYSKIIRKSIAAVLLLGFVFFSPSSQNNNQAGILDVKIPPVKELKVEDTSKMSESIVTVKQETQEQKESVAKIIVKKELVPFVVDGKDTKSISAAIVKLAETKGAALSSQKINLPGKDTGDDTLYKDYLSTGKIVQAEIFDKWNGDVKKLNGVQSIIDYIKYLKENKEKLNDKDRAMLKYNISKEVEKDLLKTDITEKDILYWLWNKRIFEDCVKTTDDNKPEDVFSVRAGTGFALEKTSMQTVQVEKEKEPVKEIVKKEVKQEKKEEAAKEPVLKKEPKASLKSLWSPYIKKAKNIGLGLILGLTGFYLIKKVYKRIKTKRAKRKVAPETVIPTETETKKIAVFLDPLELKEFSFSFLCNDESLSEKGVTPEDLQMRLLKTYLSRSEDVLDNSFQKIREQVIEDYGLADIRFFTVDMQKEGDIEKGMDAALSSGFNESDILFVKGMRWDYSQSGDNSVYQDDVDIYENLCEIAGENADLKVMPLYYTALADARKMLSERKENLNLRYQMPLTDDEKTEGISFFKELYGRIVTLAEEENGDPEKGYIFFSNSIPEMKDGMSTRLQKVIESLAGAEFIYAAA